MTAVYGLYNDSGPDAGVLLSAVLPLPVPESNDLAWTGQFSTVACRCLCLGDSIKDAGHNYDEPCLTRGERLSTALGWWFSEIVKVED